MGRGTREKIMNVAIEMFNSKGATNVSTVQLSNQLHISPGNLYYYFDNKEHLIRSIWLEMLAPNVGDLFYAEELETKEEALMDFFLQLSQSIYAFKFFYLELPAMLHNDPELKAIYKERAEKLMLRMEEVFDAWVENGIMKPMDKITKKLLIENCWTLSQTSITYVTILGFSATVKEGCDNIIQHLYALLFPYFSEESHEKIHRLFIENNLSFQKYA